jgi:cysteine-rich repeat protein
MHPTRTTARPRLDLSLARPVVWALVAIVVTLAPFGIAPAAAQSPLGGPVIIGGDDADDHGSVRGGVNLTGYKYIEKAFDNMGPAVQKTGKVAVCIGCNGLRASTAFQSGFDLSTLPGKGWTRVALTTTAQITGFFNGTGTNNVNNSGLIYMPTDAANITGGITAAQLTTVNSNASGLASFVASGGGLFAHSQGSTTGGWGWLTTLIPGITPTPEGSCTETDLTLTPVGQTTFPGLTNADVDNATPWHEIFLNNFGGLDVLVTGPCPTGQQAVILGGVTVLGSQIDIDPKLALNPIGTSHTVTATVKNTAGLPLPNTTVTFTVQTGPNAGTTGSALTNASGVATFTWTDVNGRGLDAIRASFVNPNTGQVDSTVQALKFWDDDCNGNGAPDGCDVSCAAFGGVCNQRYPATCGHSLDADTNGVPDECAMCGNGVIEGAERCDDGNTFAGDCCSPTCQLEAAGTVCRSSAGACDPAETCTGTTAVCPANVLTSAGTQCRASAGICDVAESCTGSSAACPADVLVASGTSCRPAAGPCDVTESCTGSSAVCPADVLVSAGTQCRASAGACDVAESCNGTNPQCPADALVGAGTTCRAAAGTCDVAETCSGSSAACPADVLIAAGTSCRAAAGACDVAETCSGSSAACPADTLAAAGTSCRAAAGTCDVAETCSGSSAACPADVLAAAGTTCRAAAGVCDVAETCSGSSAACPTDARAGAGTSCRAAAGDCDVAEVCDGTAVACPADVLIASGTTCRAAAGACDVAETCSGSSAACPVDTLAAAGTSCRSVAGGCDLEEVCTGTAAACPADVLVAAGTSCRAAAGACDVAETCSGSSPACPADVLVAAGTSCRVAAGPCDVAETCSGSSPACPADVLVASGTSCRAAVGACDIAESCSGSSPACPADALVRAATECRASAGPCDVAEACTGLSGACPPDAFRASSTVCRAPGGECDRVELCSGNAATCPADAKSTAVCRSSTGACDAAESCDGASNTCPPDAATPDGAACDDGTSCTNTDRCVSGTCSGTAVGSDPFPDCQEPVCAPDCGPIRNVCNHPCMSKLLFRTALDFFHLQGAVYPATAVDPATESVTLVIRNANELVYGQALPGGSFQRRRNGNWIYTSRTARTSGGLLQARLFFDNKGDPGALRFALKGFGDLSKATLPQMTVEVIVGNDIGASTRVWTPLRAGWTAQLP